MHQLEQKLYHVLSAIKEKSLFYNIMISSWAGENKWEKNGEKWEKREIREQTF